MCLVVWGKSRVRRSVTLGIRGESPAQNARDEATHAEADGARAVAHADLLQGLASDGEFDSLAVARADADFGRVIELLGSGGQVLFSAGQVRQLGVRVLWRPVQAGVAGP